MYKKNKLENGLRIITNKILGTQSATVLVLVGAGSRYEKIEQRGLSHFLEHMFFKGAKKYENTKQVSEAIDSVGGEFNAFTGKEYAGYYVKVGVENIEIACDVLSDMMIHSTFKQEEIEKERGVILEEYNMYQDTPMYQIGWDFERLVFGDQPLGWDQIGTKEVIGRVMNKDFVDYKKQLYTPENTVIAVVGNIDEEKILEMVKKYFVLENAKKAFEFAPAVLIEGEKVFLREKKTEQAHVAIGFPGYAETHKDHWALKVLSVILGGNMSSRMFLGVREAKGLAYYIHTTTDDYMDGGAIVTNAGVDLKRIDDAVKGIIEEYRKLRDEGVLEDELKKAKSFVKGKMVLNLEDSEEYAHLLAKYALLHGEAKSPEEIAKAVEAVTIDDVMRVARDLFKAEKMKIAAIGPYDDKSRFEKLAEGL
ncbi:insulinase family protein [Candidatus Gracilibacteria bacterium]|nr:insulinase family protein [Candidatus Gracilibacteria bacterium]